SSPRRFARSGSCAFCTATASWAARAASNAVSFSVSERPRGGKTPSRPTTSSCASSGTATAASMPDSEAASATPARRGSEATLRITRTPRDRNGPSASSSRRPARRTCGPAIPTSAGAERRELVLRRLAPVGEEQLQRPDGRLAELQSSRGRLSDPRDGDGGIAVHRLCGSSLGRSVGGPDCRDELQLLVVAAPPEEGRGRSGRLRGEAGYLGGCPRLVSARDERISAQPQHLFAVSRVLTPADGTERPDRQRDASVSHTRVPP